jgi:signal transduction histidine kinase
MVTMNWISSRDGGARSVNETRNLKHELRTPVNHIVGYSALLLESAQDTGNDTLARQAVAIQTIGNELNRVIEGVLTRSQRTLRAEDIIVIKDALAPLHTKIEEGLTPDEISRMDESYLTDMQRIRNAIQRLLSLLERIEPLPDVAEG